MRYLIASLLEPQSDQRVRQAYQDAYNEPCRVRTLHLTYIPPFTTSTINSVISRLQSIPIPPLTYTPQSPDLFKRKRHILYLPLQPAAPLQTYVQTLLPLIRQYITFEATDFPKNEIPDFLPHITLSYDFKLNQAPLQPPATVTVLPPALLEETGPGIWQSRQT